MRAHPKTVRDRFEVLAFFMNAVTSTPPPCLMNKRTVRRIHEADDAVVDVAGEIGGKVSDLVFFAERGNRGGGVRRFATCGESSSLRPWLRYEYPDEVIALFTWKASRVNA